MLGSIGVASGSDHHRSAALSLEQFPLSPNVLLSLLQASQIANTKAVLSGHSSSSLYGHAGCVILTHTGNRQSC